MSLVSILDDKVKLLEYISSCLKPKLIEKSENGEVFTPMHLIEMLLDQLPQETWSNKNLKILDLSCGMGNFPISLYYKLMKGLSDGEFKTPEDKKKHILENMLYMSELNKKNCFLVKQILDPSGEYKLNLYQGDSLTLDIKKEFKVNSGFDVIIGNPPYNSGGIKSHTGNHLSKDGKKNKTIWPDFVKISLKHLKQNGYLVHIHPLSWLKSTHSVHTLLLEKHITYLRLWDNIKSLKNINGKIPISLYVLHNVLNTEKLPTQIISEIDSKHLITESMVYLNKQLSIPLAYHSIFNKIKTKIDDEKLNVEVLTKTVKSEGKAFKLPLEFKQEDNIGIDTYRLKDGHFVKKVKSGEVHPHFKTKKLVIPNKSSFKGVFLDDGKLSLVGNHKFYLLSKPKVNLEKIQKVFELQLFNKLSHFMKYGQDFLDKSIFDYIPNLSHMNLDDITDLNVCRFFELTSDEITQILGNQEVNEIEEVQEEVHEEDLKKKTIKELKELCKAKGLKNLSKLKKDELIKLLE